MILRLFFVILAISGLFVLSLMMSYEILQITPSARSQQFLIQYFIPTVESSCKEMDKTLDDHNYSPEHIIRAINDGKLHSLDLSSKDIDSITTCLKGTLPEIGSYPISEKIGFIEGIGNHKVKGQANVITIEKTSYLRIEDFEISYGTKNDGSFILPELHLYLIPYDQISANLNLDMISEKDYLDQLHVNLGSKNYKLPSDKYLSEYDGILIYDEIHKTPYAKIKLEHADYLRDGFNNFFNDLITVDSPKFESKIVYERNGFLEGIDNYHAKGTVILDYKEDEGELKFEQFEISKGADLGIYLTKDGDVGKSGYWIFDDTGNVYVSSTNTDQVLRYSSDGTFKDVFVEANSGGLDGPKDLIFDDNNNLYVSSTNTDQVLRYSSDGTFNKVFVQSNAGGLDGPRDLVFNNDNLYVSTLDEVFRFDKFGKFKDIFIKSGKGGLDSPNGLVFDDNNNLYVSSTNTDQVLRYSSDGTFKDVFVEANSGGLDGPKDLMFSSDNNFLYVASFLTNEVLKYDKEGVFQGDIISSRNGNIVSPEHGTFDSNDNLYVSTLDEVFRFDKFGKFKDIFIKSGKGGLDSPNGLVFDDNNNLYVSSTNTDQVLRYSSDGTFKDVFVEANSGGLDGPKDLIFDDNNNLYVSSTNTDQVLRYSSDGEFDSTFVTSDYIKNPQGLTFGSNGDLYVISTTTDELLRFDSKGEFIEVFASGGGLDSPADVSFDGDFFYVSSTNTDQVLRYSSDGTFKDVFITSDDITNPQGLLFNTNKDTLYAFSSDTNEVIKTTTENDIRPEKFITDVSSALYQPKQLGLYDDKLCVSNYLTDDIQCYDEKTGENSMKLVVSFDRGLITKAHSVVGPDGELYVPDRFRNQIHRYDGITGIFSEIVIKTGDDLLQEPSYLSFDNEGKNLYVSSDDKIFKFDGEEGNFIHTFISKNTGLNNPKGLSFDENYLYVNSHDNSRILRYDLDGNFVDTLIHSRDNGLFEPTGLALGDNHLYVSSKNNEILKYDKHTGEFLDEIKTSSTPHGIILDNKNNILYISIYDTNEIHAYDLDTGQLSVLISDEDGLEGPEGLAFDGENYLYVSSSQNNTIFAYNLDNKTISPISVQDGNGILLKPIGLVLKDNFLYISNSGNDGILRYDPVNNTLNDFVKDTRDLIRPGEITFGPDGDLFVINENDNGIYRYNINDGSIQVFTPSFFFTMKHDSKNNMRDIIFNKDNTRLFATVPTENKILYFDKSGVFEGEFKNSVLEYPTNLAVSPDGKYLWVVNYGKNTLVSFNMDDGILDKTITPGENGLTRIKDVRFGQDGNMYVMGGDYDQVLKYNIADGNYLGVFDNGGTYLGKLRENAIVNRYFVNEIDTKQNNIVMIYDHLLERPYSKVILNETVDLLTPIHIGLNSLISSLRDSQEPKLQSTGFTKNTGFFVSAERNENTGFFNFLFESNPAVYGQAIIKNIDRASLITIESFFIDYDKNVYLSTEDSNSIFTNGPNLIACLIKSGYHPTCNSNDTIELGKLDVNAGDNRFVVNNVDFDDYDRIVVYDTTFEKSLAFIPLQDYGILRVSGESFLDWLQYELLVIPLLFVSVMLFPIVFDYSRGLFKIFFFIGYLIKERNTKKVQYFPTDKKVSILIPAHNEEYGIKKSIETALASTYPNKEVIVIDDGSTDGTYIIANSFAEKGLIKLVHHDIASGSKATALNYGVNYATGDYVLCMDGDTQLDKYALENTARFFDDDDISAFSGNVRILSGDDGVVNLLTKLQTYEYSIAIGLGRRFTSVFGILLVISGAFGIFKTDVMKSVHGFEHKTMTEDFDLTLKVKKTKKKIKFVPDSIANTYCPNNWTAWINQRNRWAYGQFQTLLRHKNLLFSFNTFKRRDQVAFSDLILLDMFLVLFFPIGLTSLGLISIALILGDNLHVVVYPLTFVMCVFMIFEFTIFVIATIFSRKYSNFKLLWLVPIMTFFYRPYLKMITLRAYFRAYFKRQTSW